MVVSTAPSDGGHDGNGITVADHSGLFLQVTDVFVVEVDIHEGAQFTVFGVEVAAQVGVLGDEISERVGDGGGLHLDSGLLSGVLAKGRRNVDLRHL